MAIAQSLLPEFDNEMANTRKALALFPEDQADWKPHVKSFSIGNLALHLARLPNWTTLTLKETELDLSQPDASERPTFTSSVDLLELFDKNVAAAREVLAATTDEDMMVTWTLKHGEHVVLALPRVAVLRSFVMNHSIHHRGQFTVYLRLLDIPLPALYGPTADSNN